MIFNILGILSLLTFMSVSAVATDDVEYIEEEIEYIDDEEYFIDEYQEDYVDEEEPIQEIIDEVPVPRAVAQRMTCTEINQRVSELREDVKAYPDLKADLDYMLSRQRVQCAPRANRRPVHNYNNVNPVRVLEVVEPEPEVVEEVVPEPEPVVIEKTPEELAAEQAAEREKIAENMAKGLCGDGSKPNRFGCCVGEKFKEVLRMEFACCKEDNDTDCHEPLKKIK